MPPIEENRQKLLKRGLDDSITGLHRVAGLRANDDPFAGGGSGMAITGGVQGASSLNDSPEIRRAVTSKRAQTRDLRLARRNAIRKGDRLGAARISSLASSQGMGLHGIGRYGDNQQAAAINISSRYLESALESAQKYGNSLDGATASLASQVTSPPPGTTDEDVIDDVDVSGEAINFKNGVDAWMRSRASTVDPFSSPYFQPKPTSKQPSPNGHRGVKGYRPLGDPPEKGGSPQKSR